MTTLTSREFNHDIGRAKREAKNGPVFITNRGQPSHVLMTIEAYEHLAERGENIVDQLAMPGAAEIDFEPARLDGPLVKAVDFS